MEISLRSDANEGQLNLLFEMMEEVKHVPGSVVEIGSWKCGTSGALAAMYPERQVYAFDLFGGMPYGLTGGPFDYFADTDWKEVQATVACFPNLALVRGEHEKTVPEFAKHGGPIALLYMDSDHYSSHRVSLECLCPLVAHEGVIVFHDWRFAEVQQAVTEIIVPEEWKILDGREAHGMGVLRKN